MPVLLPDSRAITPPLEAESFLSGGDPVVVRARRVRYNERCTCVDSVGRSVSRGRDCRRGPVPFLSKQASKNARGGRAVAMDCR